MLAELTRLPLQEHQNTTANPANYKWLRELSLQCFLICEAIDEDIPALSTGEKPALVYGFTDACGEQLKLSHYTAPISTDDIRTTTGFQVLAIKAASLGLNLRLQQGFSLDQSLTSSWTLQVRKSH